MEVWAVLSDSDKQTVSDFFRQWTDLWRKWSGFMAPGQQAHFVAYMNSELLEQVASFRGCYAKQLAARTVGPIMDTAANDPVSMDSAYR